MLKTVALNMYNVQHLYSIYNVSLNILCAKSVEDYIVDTCYTCITL